MITEPSPDLPNISDITKKKKPCLIAETGLLSLKDGGLLLSRIALQYHRRRRA